MVAACRKAGAVAIINDRVDVALASNAHGVHVGQVPSAAAVAAAIQSNAPHIFACYSTTGRQA